MSFCKWMLALALLTLSTGCGSNFEWFPSDKVKPIPVDTVAPAVTSFVYTTENGSLIATIETLIATDNVAVTGYLVTETATAPAAADAGWSATVPATYNFATATGNVLYVWARDAAGNVSAAKSVAPVYQVQRTVLFPTGVLWVADIAYDTNSNAYWLLASGTTGATPDKLVKIDANSNVLATLVIPYNPWRDYIGDGSTLAFDGGNFWISGSGYDNSVVPPLPKSEIYQLSAAGQYLATHPCPATASGFCQGLAWDGTNLWAAGSDNRNLVKFSNQPGLALEATYPTLWSSNGISDAGYDRTTGQLLVLKDGLSAFDSANGVRVINRFTVPWSGRGDWDGQYFWLVDNASRALKVLFVK